MTLTTFAGWLKTNWYVPLLLVGVAGAIIFGRTAPTIGGDEAPRSQAPRDERQDALRSEFERAKAQTAQGDGAPREAKTPDSIIEEHLAKLDQAPPPDEAAALLSALGNLHRQKKRDYATAARYYEQLIETYPDWPGIKGVYHQLMTCYSRLEDQPSLRLLYRKMVEVFPEESNEYQFAKDALGE